MSDRESLARIIDLERIRGNRFSDQEAEAIAAELDGYRRAAAATHTVTFAELRRLREYVAHALEDDNDVPALPILRRLDTILAKLGA